VSPKIPTSRKSSETWGTQTWGTPGGPEIAQDGSLAFIMRRTVEKFLCAGTLLLLAACATIAPPKPPSLELPKPPADLRAVRRGDTVILTWTVPARTTDRQTIRSSGPTRICRGLEPKLAECGKPVGLAASSSSNGTKSSTPATSSYTDTLTASLESDDPSAFITYALELLNADGRSAGLSNQVQVPLLRLFPPVPRDFAAHVSGQGVGLAWTGTPLSLTGREPVVYRYRVYRRIERDRQPVLIGEVPVGMESHPSLTDQSFEWEITYYYHLTILTVVHQKGKEDVQIESDDSPEIKVFADDVFPPAVPSGLQAVFSGPGQQRFVDLIWAPVTDLDLEGYNIYRHEDGGAPVKVNAEVVKAPTYRDGSVEVGRKYFYSVSALDVRGNESVPSEEASESVP